MKELFAEVEIELVYFDVVDVITTSNGNWEEDDELIPEFWG